MQKLLSKSKFAEAAGVNPSTITRICGTLLKAAVVGKQVDAAHPDAVKYLQDRERDQTPAAATGLDPLYEEVVKSCAESGKYSISSVQRKCRIGYNRAAKIVEVMKVNGLIPDKNAPPIPVVTIEQVEAAAAALEQAKKPHVRGHTAAKEARKREAAQEDEIIEIPEDIQEFADMTLRDLVDKFGTDARFVDWLSATQKIEAINEKRLKNATTQGTLVSRDLVRVGIIEPIDAAHIKLLTDGAKTIARRSTAMHSAGRPLDDIEKFVAEQITSFIRPVKSKVARALKNA